MSGLLTNRAVSGQMKSALELVGHGDVALVEIVAICYFRPERPPQDIGY